MTSHAESLRSKAGSDSQTSLGSFGTLPYGKASSSTIESWRNESHSELEGMSRHRLEQKRRSSPGRRSDLARHLLVAIFVTFLLFWVLHGIVQVAFKLQSLGSSPDEDSGDCDLTSDATPAAQKKFIIDIRYTKNYNYADVRLIDIAWDVLAQIGRSLHGWFLCRYVVLDSLVRIMEYSNVPYEAYVDLSLQTVSWSALCSLISLLFRKPKGRVVALAIWHVFAIGYVLAFPSLWGAATGYLNPSNAMYRMPDGSLVDRWSSQLSLCYSLDGASFGAVSPLVIRSADMSSLRQTAAQTGLNNNYQGGSITSFSYQWAILYDIANDRLYRRYGYHDGDDDDLSKLSASDRFLDVMTYAQTKANIYAYLGCPSKDCGQPGNFRLTRNVSTKVGDLSDTWDDPSQMPFTIKGWKVSSQDPNVISLDRPAPAKAPKFYAGFFYSSSNNTYILRNASSAVYLANASVALGTDVLPYNSSITLNNTEYSLPAPFLDLNKGCAPVLLSVGRIVADAPPCVCFNNQPIPYSFDRRTPAAAGAGGVSDGNVSSPIVCVSENSYVWGFPSTITLVALALEFIWIVGCWAVWLDAQINSPLLRRQRRSGAGLVRTALDLAGSVNRDLGPQTTMHADSELRRALKEYGKVRYSVEGEGDSWRVVVVSEVADGVKDPPNNLNSDKNGEGNGVIDSRASKIWSRVEKKMYTGIQRSGSWFSDVRVAGEDIKSAKRARAVEEM